MSYVERLVEKILDHFDELTPQKLKEYADEALSMYQKMHEENFHTDLPEPSEGS